MQSKSPQKSTVAFNMFYEETWRYLWGVLNPDLPFSLLIRCLVFS